VAFVVTSGQIAAVDRAVPPLPPRVQLTGGYALDYEAIWRTQPHVRTCVSFIARNIAQLGLHLYRRRSDVDRERVTDHPVARLLGRPNLRTGRFQAIDALVNDLGIYDEAYWLKLRQDDVARPVGLLRLPPAMVTPLGESWVAPDGYRVRGARGFKDVPADQVVHFHGYHPTTLTGGASPIEAIRQILSEEYAAERYREQLWRNGARVSGYLKRPREAPQWSDKARTRFQAGWQAQYAGDGPQSGGTPLLEDGMEFVQASFSPEQAQYVETRKLTREEVAAIYHIPLPMVGILDHATFSNITEQHKQLYQDTLGPWLQMIVEVQASQLQTAVGAPWLTRNEARARMNLPQIDGADELVTPLNVLVGGQASPTDSAPTQES